jgi:endonuclease YncB( thermonuclease family)
MRSALSILLLLLIPLFGHAETLTGKVVKITDGDTLVVLDASQTQHKVRLAGIDAPETSQPFGQRSKEALSALVAGQPVEVDWPSMIATSASWAR